MVACRLALVAALVIWALIRLGKQAAIDAHDAAQELFA